MNLPTNVTVKPDNLNDISDGNIQRICEQASTLYEQKEYDAALRLYYKAWLTLPKPQMEQENSEIILSLIGDTYYQLTKYEPAIEAFRSALACQQTERRVFVLLRLGQALLNIQQELQAKTYLQKAYRLGGKKIFETESDIYLKAIKGLI